MRKMKIVTDSSSDVLSLDQVDFSGTPLKITADGRNYVDDEALDVDAMVDFLYQYKGKSLSACPSTGEWLDAFEGADDVFCFTITRNLSGSYNSALSAKQIYESENEGKRVYLFDTLSTGPEVQLAIEKTRECMLAGMTYEQICDTVSKYIKRTGLIFMLKSVKTLANNGRISPIVAKLVGIAGIRIIGKASDEGTLETLHKCKGDEKSLKTIMESLVSEGYVGGKISIGHCQNLEIAEKLRDMILTAYKNAKIEIHKLRGLCSFYAEKGGVLIGFEKN